MKLEIKDFYSPDIESIWQWEPTDLSEVCFLLEMNIGEVGADSSDVFQVLIATPEGLRVVDPNDDFVLSDRACLIVREYSWKNILKKINQIVKVCSANDWVESTIRLQRYFQWEYEDYLMDDHH